MKNLKPLDGKHFERLEKIIEEKRNPNKARLIILKPLLSERYSLYAKEFLTSRLHYIPVEKYHEEDKGYLQECYKSKSLASGAFKELIKEIHVIQDRDLQGTCQYCGIQRPNTFDHYMPQSKYPEYSAMGLNLVPCCGECNSKKGSYWLEGLDRGIINFYTDTLPQEQLLFVDVKFDKKSEFPSVDFYVNLPKDVLPIHTIFERHYKRLGLCERYKDGANDFITDKATSMITYLNSKDRTEIKRRMAEEFEILKVRLGINNWRTVLMCELSKNNNFVEFVIKQMKE